MNKLRFVIVCICATLFGLKCEAKLFELYEYFLPNGLRVIVVPNHKAPIIRQMLWYKVGALDEKIGKGGSAHLLEHLMFRGTKNIRGDEFNQIMQKNGAESNAFTSQNFTVYHQSVDISRLELAMFLEADRMQNLNITPDSFEKEQKIVFEERKQVVENNPFSAFSESIRRALWQDHPFARPITGTSQEILSLKLKDVNDIYNYFYVPNNAVLVLSGDIKPQVAYELALKYYGKIKPNPDFEPTKLMELKNLSKSNMHMNLPRVNVARLTRNYIAPSYNYQKDKIYAYMVLASYLAQGETSALYRDLVLDNKKAIAVFGSYDYTSRSYGSFYISAIPQKEVELAELQKALDKALAKAIDNLDNNELDIIKNKMLAGLVYLKDNPNDAGYIVGNLASIGMSKEEIENYAEQINNVSLSDVKNAFEELFDNSSMIEGWAKPQTRGANE